ncbi:MAG TPA: response regulator transcription factor [Lacunisphaera sp.]|jgi:two-component system OmpR family response regulator|nr:response regulator transcription factor [Lacunisphaera sp.]HQY06917.1 response regulator transcription factor [Lacunisphaera sp.]
MRILVIEDDPKLAAFVTGGLKQAGFAVDQAADGLDGLALARQGHYAAAVVDLMLPKLDGLALIGSLRAEKNQLPVIILSARAKLDDRIQGLQAGGDDYLTKPFAFSELHARLQSLIRRAQPGEAVAELANGGVTLNLLTREVARDGRKLDLQAREFALLELLLRHPGRVLTKTFLLERLWDYSFDPQTNVVDVLVCRLRGKVDRDFDARLIHTVRGAGYVFKVD